MATSENEDLTSDIWICDSGACGHYCNFKEGLFDTREINEEITIGNGKSMIAAKVGSLKCKVIQVDGSSLDVTLHEVKYVPELWVNLFSINKALKNGFSLSNKGVSICLSKGSASVTFDRVFRTTNGFVSGIKMSVYDSPVIYNATKGLITNKCLDINRFHEILGHCGLDRLQKTAKIHGLKLKGDFEVCKDCAVAKARQKNVNKVWKVGSQIPGERLYLDISSIKEKSFGGAKFWVLIVDDYTDFCWSLFLKSKSELKSKMMDLLTDLKIASIDVKIIRCNNASENKVFYEECRSKGMNIRFEFSGPRTPKRNGKVERKFQTFYGRIRAMLNCAGLKDHLRNGVWAECAMTVTFLSNIISIKSDEKCPYQLLFGAKPKLPSALKAFGEIGVVTTKDDIQGKLKNRGTYCMFVGYSVNHANDVYRMLNLETKGIINTRDVTWLGKYHKDWIAKKLPITESVNDDDDDELDDLNIQKGNQEVQQIVNTNEKDDQRNKKVYRQMRMLESSFNPEASKIVEEFKQGRDILLDQVNIALLSANIIKEPTTFDEAWNCANQADQIKWREAIKKEFNDMNDKKVWSVINKESIPEGRRCIKCKWIFKIKRNGVFRARLVACGYSQVPGVDFNESFAPVINDVSFRIMLIVKLIWKLQASIIDVETAFLHGNLQEEIYMNIPEGMESNNNQCLLLNKTIYGLVQSAREFYKRLIEVLKSIGFIENKSDPCLLSKWDKEDVMLIGIYVDDCIVIGKEEQISKLIDDLKSSGFNLKIENNLTDYLSCRIIENKERGEILVMQPHLINRLIEKFGDEVKDKRVYKTPGTPRFKIVRPDCDSELIDKETQQRYRSGVGMLLYLT